LTPPFRPPRSATISSFHGLGNRFPVGIVTITPNLGKQHQGLLVKNTKALRCGDDQCRPRFDKWGLRVSYRNHLSGGASRWETRLGRLFARSHTVRAIG
jgi:hypothetical protein